MSESTTILPCPFCGAAPTVEVEEKPTYKTDFWAFISCNNHGGLTVRAHGTASTGYQDIHEPGHPWVSYRTEEHAKFLALEQATKRWNQRPTIEEGVMRMTPKEALAYLHKQADPGNMTFSPKTIGEALSALGLDTKDYEERVTDLDAFLDNVRAEVTRARHLFPGRQLMTMAFNEEAGELTKAVLDEPWANVYKEAVQAAAMAVRVALDGDESVDGWRDRKELDNPTNPLL